MLDSKWSLDVFLLDREIFRDWDGGLERLFQVEISNDPGDSREGGWDSRRKKIRIFLEKIGIAKDGGVSFGRS